MIIGLHDGDIDHFRFGKNYPNLALMKISAFYKQDKNNIVEWFNPLIRDTYDLVFSSKIFSWTRTDEYLPKNIIKGGTGYGLYTELHEEIDSMYPDYSIYPNCNYAIGFLTRGCIRSCDFCIVPKKEGNIRPYKKWQDVVRKDTKKIVLMDNNILACDYGIGQLEELSKTNYRVDLNQGMDARLLDDNICKIIKGIKWIKYIRFACDSIGVLPYVEKLIELFDKYKIPKSRVFFYVIIRNPNEAEYIIQALNKMSKNFNIYAQAEIDKNGKVDKINKEYSRYVFGRCYHNHTWETYKEKYNI